MKPRLIMIVAALVIGLIAAFSVNNYISGIKKQAAEEQKTVKVWVAEKDISKGTSIEDIEKNRLAELRSVPRKYVASQAISSTRNIEGQVLNVSLSAGEQLTTGKFNYPTDVGLACTVPKGHIAVSIPYENAKGVAGMVKPGDLVTVFATFEPGPSGEDETKILLQKVKVTAVGMSTGVEKQDVKSRTVGVAEAANNSSVSSSDKKTITLALSPADAEKLVFSQENGKVWLGLHPSGSSEAVATEGVVINTVFK